MELVAGDLVRHNIHGWWGIVVSKSRRYMGCFVCKVEWCVSGKSNLIDINFLDKITNTG